LVLYVWLYLCQDFHLECLEYSLPCQDQMSVCLFVCICS
jgi:hypothetical protein